MLQNYHINEKFFSMKHWDWFSGNRQEDGGDQEAQIRKSLAPEQQEPIKQKQETYEPV